MNGISRGVCNQGNYHLHASFLHLLEQPEDVQFFDGCVLPKDIVKHIKKGMIFNADKHVAVESEGGKQTINTGIVPPLSQTARAKALLESGKISFDLKLHLFNVLGSGDKPYVVRLFPAEYCCCPSKGVCYHIIAVKKSVGCTEELKSIAPNLALLQRNIRDRGMKSGRKRPRANDAYPSDGDLEVTLNPKKTEVYSHTENVPGNVDINHPESSLPDQASNACTSEDDMISDDYDSQDNFMPSLSPARYFDDGNGLPGTSMFQETPIEVSKQMQQVVSESCNIFDSPPIVYSDT